MYDERIYYDPISDQIFLVKFYLNYTFSYENIPERFFGTNIGEILNQHEDFEAWLDSTGCVVIGHI
jgi:hypothetical protein